MFPLLHFSLKYYGSSFIVHIIESWNKCTLNLYPCCSRICCLITSNQFAFFPCNVVGKYYNLCASMPSPFVTHTLVNFPMWVIASLPSWNLGNGICNTFGATMPLLGACVLKLIWIGKINGFLGQQMLVFHVVVIVIQLFQIMDFLLYWFFLVLHYYLHMILIFLQL